MTAPPPVSAACHCGDFVTDAAQDEVLDHRFD
jgi:hypothetical protein